MKKDKFSHLTREELVAKAQHDIPLENVVQYCDPFEGCWIELESPITKQEVLDCIAAGEAALVETPIWADIILRGEGRSPEDIRKNHIRKIAYFATNDIEKPISIDVGIPAMGCFVDHIVDDGNHRLAGAIIKGAKTIGAWVCGEIEHAKTLGLYFPNEYERALCKRDDADYKAKQKAKQKAEKVTDFPDYPSPA